MASDMSGYANDPQAWMRDSGGTMADYNREMEAWRASTQQWFAPVAAALGQPQSKPAQPQTQSQPINYGNLTAEQSGIQAFNPNDPKAIFQTTSSQDLANMTPEQRARWSMEHIDVLSGEGNRSAPGATREQAYNQWMAWQDHFDPNCPSNTPYRGSRTGTGCYEKPDDDLKDFMGDKWYTSQGLNPDGSPRGGQGGGGGGAAGGGEPIDPLQQALVDRFQGREGMFQGGASGQDLAGGGVFWQGDQPQGAVAAPMFNPGIGHALLDATLNAFTPNAPSQRSSPQPAAPAPTSQVSGALEQAISAIPAITSGFSSPPSDARISPAKENLDPALKYRFKDPNAWWADESTKSRGGSVQRLA